jgi:hypothetical protein
VATITTRSNGSSGVYVGTPQISLQGNRAAPDVPWHSFWYRTGGPSLDFETAFEANRFLLPYFEHALLPVGNLDGLTVTSIGVSPRDGEVVRVSFSAHYPGVSEESDMTGWWDLDPRLDYGVVAMETPFGKKSCFRTKVGYETMNGFLVPKKREYDVVLGDGRVLSRTTWEIQSCQFVAPPAEVFEMSSYGKECREAMLNWGEGDGRMSGRKIGPVCWTAGGWSVATLLLAMPLLVRRRGSETS